MNLEPYVLLDGVELANSHRTLTYLRTGLGGTGWTVALDGNTGGTSDLRCFCDTFDDGPYEDPETDEAPWYDADRPESGEFLGLIPRITLLPAARHNLTARAMGRGDVGPRIVGPRIIQVEGTIFAGSKAGMGYGERWLNRILAGSAEPGCAGVSMTVLPYCTDNEEDDGLRELVPVGLIDGPIFSPPVIRATCQFQEVTFQMAAGEGWLRRTTELFSGPLAGVINVVMTAPVAADAAAIVTIEAGGTTLDDVDIADAPPFEVDLDIVDLPANHKLVIDASTHTVLHYDASDVVVGGLEVLDFTGLLQWFEAAAGESEEINVDTTGATGLAGATITIEQVDMEL